MNRLSTFIFIILAFVVAINIIPSSSTTHAITTTIRQNNNNNNNNKLSTPNTSQQHNIPLGQEHSFPVSNVYLTQQEVHDLFYRFFWNTYFINVTSAVQSAWTIFDDTWSVFLVHPCAKKETAGSQVFEFHGLSEKPVLGDLEILNNTYNITVLPGGKLQITGLVDWKATTNTVAFGVQGNCPVSGGDCSCATGSIDFLCCKTESVANRKCLGGVEVSIHTIYNASLILEFVPTATGYVQIVPTSTVFVNESKIVYPCKSIYDPSSIQSWLYGSNKTFMNNLTTSLLYGQELIRQSIQEMQLDFTQVTLRASMRRQITQLYQVPSSMWVSYFITRFWSSYENFFTIFVNASFSFVAANGGWQQFFNASLCQKTQENPPAIWADTKIKTGIRVSSAALQAMVWAAYIDGTFHMFNRHRVVDAEVLLRMFVTEPVTSVPQNEVLHMYIDHGSANATCVSEIDHRNKTLVQASFASVGVKGGIDLKGSLPLTIYGKIHNFEFQRAQFRIEKPTGGFPRRTLQRIIEKGLNESIPFVNWGLKRNGFSFPSVTQYLLTPPVTTLDIIYRPDITCAFSTHGADQGYFQLATDFPPPGGSPVPTPMPTRHQYAPGTSLFKMIASLFKRDPAHNSTVRRGTACDPSVTGNQMVNVALIVDEKHFSSVKTTGTPAESPCQLMLGTPSSEYFFKLTDVTLRQINDAENPNQFRYFPGSVSLLCSSATCEPQSCLYVGAVSAPDECVWLDPFDRNTSSMNMSEPLSWKMNSTVEFDAMAMSVVPGDESGKNSDDGDSNNNNNNNNNNQNYDPNLPDLMCSPATVRSSSKYRQPGDSAETLMIADAHCGLQENAFWTSTVAISAPQHQQPQHQQITRSNSNNNDTEQFITYFHPPFEMESVLPLYVGVDINNQLYYCQSNLAKVPLTIPYECVEPPISLQKLMSPSMNNPRCEKVDGKNMFPNSTINAYFIKIVSSSSSSTDQGLKICPSQYVNPNSNSDWNSDINIESANFLWFLVGGVLVLLLVIGVLLTFLNAYLRRLRQKRRVEEVKRNLRRERHKAIMKKNKKNKSKNNNKYHTSSDQNNENENEHDNDEEDTNPLLTTSATHQNEKSVTSSSTSNIINTTTGSYSDDHLDNEADTTGSSSTSEDDDENISYARRRAHHLHNQPGEVWTQAEKLHSLSCLVGALAFFLLGLAWEDPFYRISMDSARGLGIPDVVDISPMADYFKKWSMSWLRGSVLICGGALLILGAFPFAGPLSVDFHETEEKDGEYENGDEEKQNKSLKNKTNTNPSASSGEDDDIDFDEIEDAEVEKIQRSYPAFGDESFWRHCRSHAMFTCIGALLIVLIFPLFLAPIRNGTFVEKLGPKNSIIGGKTTHDDIMLISSLATTLVAAPIVLNLICMFLTAIPVGTLLGLVLHDFVYGESEAVTPAAAVATITSIVDKPRPINNVVAHSVFVQLIISILLPLVVLIFVFCMFQSTQSSETWLYTWGIYCLLVVSTSAILLMRVLFRYGPATIVLTLFCITDCALIGTINHLSKHFLGESASTTFTLFHICLVIVDAIGIMEAPHEGSKKAKWYHKVADFLFRNVMNPILKLWYFVVIFFRSVVCSCGGDRKKKGGDKKKNGNENDDEEEELTLSKKFDVWIEEKKAELLKWEDEYFEKLAKEHREKKQRGQEETESNIHDDDDNENTTTRLLSSQPSAKNNENNSATNYGSADVSVENQNSRINNDDDDDENQNTNTHHRQSSTSQRKNHHSVARHHQHHHHHHQAATTPFTSLDVVQYSAATAFLRFCRDYLFMQKTGATAETSQIFGFRPWWRRLAGLICLGCFAYIVAVDSASVKETVRTQLIHALNSTLDFPSNISKIHLSVDPGLRIYQRAIDQQYTYTWVTLMFISFGVGVDWFFPNKTGLYASKIFFGIGFVVMITALLIIATPNYVKECGLANAVPYCAPKFYHDGVWILSTTSGLFFALLVLSQLAPVLIALAPTMARLLWLVASLTRIFDTRWLLLAIAIFTPVTVFLPLLAASQVTNFGPVLAVSYLLIFMPIGIGALAYALKIRSVAFISVSLIWVVVFIFLWIDLGIKLDEWNPWFLQYLVKLLSHAKFYCELFAELCLTAICTSDLILHLLRNQVGGDTHSIPPRQQQLSYFKPTLNDFIEIEKSTKISAVLHNDDDDDEGNESTTVTTRKKQSFFETERALVMHAHLLLPSVKRKHTTQEENELRDQIFENRKLHQSNSVFLDDEDARKIGFWNAAAILSPEYIQHKRALIEERRRNRRSVSSSDDDTTSAAASELALHVSPFVVDCICDCVRGAIYSGILRDGLLRKEVFSYNAEDDNDDENGDEEEEMNNASSSSIEDSYYDADAILMKKIQKRVLVLDATNWKLFTSNNNSNSNDDDSDSSSSQQHFWKQLHLKRMERTKSFLPKWRVIFGVIRYGQHHFSSFKYDCIAHRIFISESNHEFLGENSPSFMHAMAQLGGTDTNPGGFLKKLLIPPLDLLRDFSSSSSSSSSSTNMHVAARCARWNAPPPTFFSSVPQVPLEGSGYACLNDMMALAEMERGNITQTKVMLLCETLLEEQESEVDPLPDEKWALNACRLI